MKPICFLFPLVLLACVDRDSQKIQPVATIPSEHIDPTADQRNRRQQSETYCQNHAIPIFHGPNSLFTETDSAVTILTKDEVVDRALALLYVGLKGEGMQDEELAVIYKDWNISEKLSPKEKDFVTATKPSSQQRSDATWRYESLHVLLWSLGFLDSLSYPGKQCDVTYDVKIIHDLTESTIRTKARLRSKKEILDQADLILRLHWATEDARIEGKPAPAALIPDILQERHYSLNWLIRDGNSDWDDVQTGT